MDSNFVKKIREAAMKAAGEKPSASEEPSKDIFGNPKRSLKFNLITGTLSFIVFIAAYYVSSQVNSQ